MQELAGKVALVTGASRGHRPGDRRGAGRRRGQGRGQLPHGRRLRDGGRGRHRAVRRDGDRTPGRISDVSAAAAAGPGHRVRARTLGILVNNAGVLARRRWTTWIRPSGNTIRTNLSSAFYVTHAALPGMRARRWGRIIVLSSIAAQTGGVIGPHYAASKAGLLGLVHSYANLFAKDGITANAIAPALIETDMIRNNPSVTPDLIPMKRFGTAGEVAAVALMLAANGYISGQTINVNGGWYMS